MKLTLLIIPQILIFSCILNAQPDFRPGFIIKNSGDTIYGNIDYRGDILMGTICRFKENNHTAIEKYFPSEIFAFQFLDSKSYISKEINQKQVFLQFLINGIINIYYLRDESGDHYFIDKENEELTEIPYSEGIKYVNSERRYYESSSHVGVLSYYTQDAPELKSRIQSIRKPNHQNLVKLAEAYQNSIAKDEPYINYEKKLPLMKVSVQPFAGTTKYKLLDGYVAEIGGYIFIWAPRKNENTFFKSGIKYLRIEEEGAVLDIYKIPIQLQYIYRAYRLQPEISAGVNLLVGRLNDYKEIGNTLCVNAGLNYRISRKTSICSGIDFDFTPLTGIVYDNYKFSLISYSVDVGLSIEL